MVTNLVLTVIPGVDTIPVLKGPAGIKQWRNVWKPILSTLFEHLLKLSWPRLSYWLIYYFYDFTLISLHVFLFLIYNAAENNSRKINKLFRINSTRAGVVKYNNKISAHTRRLMNHFELMYAETMYYLSETDKHSANTSCLSVSSGHYIVSAYIISNN